MNSEKQRYMGIEILRFIASFGIVWFHVGAWGAHAAYGALPVFVMLSVIFVIHTDVPVKAQAGKYASRLLIPWMFWSVVYAVLKIGEAFISKKALLSKFNMSMLATGTSLHLWYLPCAFLFIMLVVFIRKSIVNKQSVFSSYVFAVITGCLVIGISSFFVKITHLVPLGQWLFLFPAISFGVFFYTTQYDSYVSILRKGFWLAMVFFIITHLLGLKGLAIPYIVAGVACFIFLVPKKTAGNIVLFLGKISFGIYLVHVIFISFFIKAGFAPKSFPLVIVTFLASVAVSAIIQKTLFRRFV